MISRIYIDNYKCFTNFEYQPGALQLLIGRNGSGKFAIFEILDALRQFIAEGAASLSTFPPGTVTAWDRRSDQTFELALRVPGGEYVYRLIVEQDRGMRRNRVGYEDLCFNGRAVYQFRGGEVHLFRDGGTAGPVFPFDPSRSAIPTIPEREGMAHLARFRSRLDRVFIFSPDPLGMTSQSEAERSHPDRRLHQLASWIRHIQLESPEIAGGLAESLRQEVLDNLVGYRLLDRGEGTRGLKFEFGSPASDYASGSKSFWLGLDELSTGQRALVALYTMLHAAVGEDLTLCIDEPDNYVALREIQPWLVELTDKVRDTGGQCLLISHHPELINYLAADCGVRFFREGGGPARVQPFVWSDDEPLRPSEIVARGWEGP